MTTILIIDDQRDMCESLAMLFRMEGYDATIATDPRKATAVVANTRPDVVLTDLRMDGMSGMDVLTDIKRAAPRTEVIIMTAFATIDTAVQAMRLGAFDYITKPFHHDAILAKIAHAIGRVDAKRGAKAGHPAPVTIVAESEAMRNVLDLVDKLAPTSMPVLLTGETGTGKSMLAHQIHDRSPRRRAPFIHVNCSALPEALVESELFGHHKGAFTGALSSHRGLFRNADGGTLFLDEIALLPLTQQPKLLIALEEHVIRPVGSNSSERIDVRVVAATNCLLAERVATGQFRQDLFYRLNAATIHVPPLRSRREDMTALAALSLARYAPPGTKPKQLSPGARAVIERHDFPGNVRELDNAMHWAQIVAPADEIAVDDLPELLRHSAVHAESNQEPQSRALSNVTRQTILESIERNRGNLNNAAKELGIGRTTLWRRMKDYGLS